MLNEEQSCQITALHWMKLVFPNEEKNTYHFANERKCSLQYGKMLKKMGVKAGVLDLFISIPKQKKSGLWLEIKVKKNVLSPFQKQFMENQIKNGFAVACCWGIEAVQKVISLYLSSADESHYFENIIIEK